MRAVDVRFRLLGPMETVVRGQPMPMPGAAERALLVQLLLSPGRTIPATMLVDRLWSESSLPVDPMNALQIRVSKLRRALRSVGVPDLVSREGTGYRADIEPDAVDAVDFAARIREARARAARSEPEVAHLESYDDALALWQGEALSDFSTEHWATVEAVRLAELRLAARTERAQIALALGRHLEVIGDLEPLVSHDPTLESLAGLLMVALYRGGRQAEALAVYTRTREVLDESLGLEPSVSLRSLHERVLRQDASLGAQPEVSPPTPAPVPSRPRKAAGPRAVPTNLPTVLRPLIGRDAQLDSLVGLVGGVRLLSLIGPGGAGKTSLALATVVRTSSAFPDGAFGVRLASVDTSDQVPLAVAEALGVPLDGAAADRDVRERLISYLARRRVLLLVDNCEHVVDAAAGLIDEMLGRRPDVTVLATSREALAVPDEVQVTVAPLEQPPRTPGVAGAAVPGSPALRRTGPRRPSGHGVRRERAARRRTDQPRARRHPVGSRAGRGPGLRHVAARDLGPARRPLLAPDVRGEDGRGPAADPASHGRLELRPAHRVGAAGVQPTLGLPGGMHPDRGRGWRWSATTPCRRGRCSTPSAGWWSAP